MTSFRVDLDVDNIYDQVVDSLVDDMRSDVDSVLSDRVDSMIDENYIEEAVKEHVETVVGKQSTYIEGMIADIHKDIYTLNQRLNITQSMIDVMASKVPAKNKTFVQRFKEFYAWVNPLTS